jgi:hypothetical protein
MAQDEDKQIVTLERVSKKRGRGRPRLIPIEPTSDEAAQLMRNKEKALNDNPLIQKLREAPNSVDVLDLAMIELAKEAGSLDFERNEAERKGKDTTTISAKKITATKAVIDTYLKKRETLASRDLDFTSPAFERLFEFFLVRVRGAASDSGMSEELIQYFFSKLEEAFVDWEDAAKEYVQG